MAADTAMKWLSSAKNPNNIEYVLSLDSDEDGDAYDNAFGLLMNGAVKNIVFPNQNAVQAFNAGAAHSTGNLLVCIGDDFNQPPFHWDEALLTQLEGKEDYIVKTGDKCSKVSYSQPWIITLPIMDRKYYERFGYVYYPEYQHMFCDTELTHVADLLDRKITLDIKFPHNHYSLMKTAPDEISRKADKTWAQGEALYLKRISENFGLSPEQIVGSLQCDAGHKQWLMSKGVYVS